MIKQVPKERARPARRLAYVNLISKDIRESGKTEIRIVQVSRTNKQRDADPPNGPAFPAAQLTPVAGPPALALPQISPTVSGSDGTGLCGQMGLMP